MVTTTDEDEDELELEEQQKKPPQIGKTIAGPPIADKGTVATSIGKPISPGAVTPPTNPAPPEVAPENPTPLSSPDTISGMGPLSPQAPMTPKPHYHGLSRVMDTIAGTTKIGSAIESAGGFGTEGWRRQNEDEQKQLEDAAKLRQQGATTEEIGARTALAGAQAGEAEARGEAAKSAAGSVGVTVNGVTYTVPQKDAEKLIGVGINTQAGQNKVETQGDTARDVAHIRAGATARHNVKVMGDGTYEEMNPGQWTRVGEAPPRAEQGNYVPINDEIGNTTGWVNPKSHTVIKTNEIPGMTGAEGAAPSGVIPPKPGPSVAANAKSAQDSLNYVKAYMDSGQFTGPGDEAMLEQFFNIAKPSSGFRMSQPQINMLMGARSWMDSAEGVAYHAQSGVWFPPDQRKQISDTIHMLATSKGVGDVKPTKGDTSSHPAGGGTSQSAPAHKVGETVKLKDGRTVKISKVHPDGSYE